MATNYFTCQSAVSNNISIIIMASVIIRIIVTLQLAFSNNKCISISIKNNQILWLVSVWDAQYFILQFGKRMPCWLSFMHVAYHTTWEYHICIILKVWWHLTQESVEPLCSTYRSGVDTRCGFYSEIVNRVLMSWKHWCCWKYECCLSLWSRWMVQYQIGYFIVRKLKSSLFMAFALKRVWILKIFAKYEILEDFGKYPLQLLSQDFWQESMW